MTNLLVKAGRSKVSPIQVIEFFSKLHTSPESFSKSSKKKNFSNLFIESWSAIVSAVESSVNPSALSDSLPDTHVKCYRGEVPPPEWTYFNTYSTVYSITHIPWTVVIAVSTRQDVSVPSAYTAELDRSSQACTWGELRREFNINRMGKNEKRKELPVWWMVHLQTQRLRNGVVGI
jgi:hypothetical protein